MRRILAHSQFKIGKERAHPENRQYRSLLDQGTGFILPPQKEERKKKKGKLRE